MIPWLIFFLIGLPLHDAEALVSAPNNPQSPDGFRRSPSDISFIRNRMLYARAALNARGLVHFGLRHIRECLESFAFFFLSFTKRTQMC